MNTQIWANDISFVICFELYICLMCLFSFSNDSQHLLSRSTSPYVPPASVFVCVNWRVAPGLNLDISSDKRSCSKYHSSEEDHHERQEKGHSVDVAPWLLTFTRFEKIGSNFVIATHPATIIISCWCPETRFRSIRQQRVSILGGLVRLGWHRWALRGARDSGTCGRC